MRSEAAGGSGPADAAGTRTPGPLLPAAGSLRAMGDVWAYAAAVATVTPLLAMAPALWAPPMLLAMPARGRATGGG